MFEWKILAGLSVTAALIATATFIILALLSRRQAAEVRSIFTPETAATVFLFDGDALVDATPSARALIRSDDPEARPWFLTLSRLEPLFPGISSRLEGISREGRFVLCSRENIRPALVIRAEWLGGMTRITLADIGEDALNPQGDGAAEAALQEEISSLRDTLSRAPLPIWRESPSGDVVWANGPYLAAAAEVLEPGKDLSWPLPKLFTAPPEQKQSRDQGRDCPSARRVLKTATATRWFEVVTLPAGTETLCYAMPIDRLVQSEAGLREFMQTLTKTFAQLPIGLAIFDRSRVLQLFNPALIDLTGLSASFLIARPTLSMLLDTMRESKMLPEPKDYRSWRRQMVEMETAAASGLLEETWTLPSGQTWKVTGRPHPNGAVAFLIEDISNEMSRTRRYRADLELGQSVIDALDDAVVVFSQDGTLSMSNRAASQLWGDSLSAGNPPRGEPGPITIWRQMTAPSLLWSDLSDYIGAFGKRDPWDGEVRLLNGLSLDCKVTPLPHGATLISFRTVERFDLSAAERPAVMIA